MLARFTNEDLGKIDINDLTGEPQAPADEEAEAERQLRILRQWQQVDRMMMN